MFPEHQELDDVSNQEAINEVRADVPCHQEAEARMDEFHEAFGAQPPDYMKYHDYAEVAQTPACPIADIFDSLTVLIPSQRDRMELCLIKYRILEHLNHSTEKIPKIMAAIEDDLRNYHTTEVTK